MSPVSPARLPAVYDLWSRETEQKHGKIADEGAGRSTGKKTRGDCDEGVRMGPFPTILWEGTVLRTVSSNNQAAWLQGPSLQPPGWEK